MKKVIVLLIALFGMTGAMAQWVPQNSGTTNDLNSVHFTNEFVGFVSGDGIILKTTDGGINWSSQNFEYWITSLYFPCDSIGYAVGYSQDTIYHGIILKTIDGGETWMTQFIGEKYFLKSVLFTDSNTGYVGGGIHYGSTEYDGVLLKTEDGGDNWVIQFFNDSWWIADACFTNSITGYIIGNENSMWNPHSVILKTFNGGIDWTSQLTIDHSVLSSIFFVNEDLGYSVGSDYGDYSIDQGLILKTLNSGANWVTQALIDSVYLSDVFFSDENTGYAVGHTWGIQVDNGIILKTTDGGENWTDQSSGTKALNSVFFTNENSGYIVGNTGTILKTTNGGATGIDEFESVIITKNLRIYPNPSNDKITLSSTKINGNTLLTILNVNGEKIIELQLTDNETQSDISVLPRGVYFVRVQDEKMTEVTKLVKQ